MFEALSTTHPLFDGDYQPNSTYSIETFPHAVVCALRGQVVSAKRKGLVRREILASLGIDPSSLRNIDFVDAALCAVAASAFSAGKFELYGAQADGFIVVPKLVDQSDRNAEKGEKGAGGN